MMDNNLYYFLCIFILLQARDVQLDAVKVDSNTTVFYNDNDILKYTVRVWNSNEFRGEKMQFMIKYKDVYSDVPIVTRQDKIVNDYYDAAIFTTLFNAQDGRVYYLELLKDGEMFYEEPILTLKYVKHRPEPRHPCLQECFIEMIPNMTVVKSQDVKPKENWYIYVIVPVIIIIIIICGAYIVYVIRKRRRDKDSDTYTYATGSNLVYSELAINSGEYFAPKTSEQQPYTQIIGFLQPK